MNKAFVKDPEPSDPRCPRPRGCDGLGIPVGRLTLNAQLPAAVAASLADAAYFCPNPACDVAYFDVYEKTVAVSALRRSIYPKDPSAPICACLGVTEAEIREQAAAGCRDCVRRVLAAAEGPDARCLTESPSGTSCATEVRRLFLQHFSEA